MMVVVGSLDGTARPGRFVCFFLLSTTSDKEKGHLRVLGWPQNRSTASSRDLSGVLSWALWRCALAHRAWS